MNGKTEKKEEQPYFLTRCQQNGVSFSHQHFSCELNCLTLLFYLR